MIHGIKARLQRHRDRLFSRRTREQHAKVKKPAIGLADLTRRALFSGGVAAIVTAQAGPVYAGWWARFAPVVAVQGLDILSYQPGVHYAVGRTSTLRPRMAVTELNRVVGFSKSQITIPSAPANDFPVSFVAEKSAFPWELYKGASITIASESTLASGTIIYVNGKVASWDWPSSTVTITVSKSGLGWGIAPGAVSGMGKPGGAGGIYFFRTGSDPQHVGNNPAFKGDDTQRSDWSLTLHLPPNMYLDFNGNFLKVSDPVTGDYDLPNEGLGCNNWDFSGVPGSLRGNNLTNGNPFIVTQCKFEQANRQIADRATGACLAMSVTNARFSNCDFPWNWRKWALTITVTSDVAAGTSQIPISGSLMENPGFLYPTEPPTLIKARSQGGQPYRYRVVNITNPKSMLTCYVSDCVDNTSITVTGLLETNPAGGPVIDTVKATDVLMCFPDPNQANFVTGNAGLITDCNIDHLQDFNNPTNILTRTSDGNGGQYLASNVITRSIINNLGAVNGHDDVSQLYNWQGLLEMSFLKINFGFKPGDEAVAAAIRCNNPREMCIWVNNMGWNGETNVHDIMMVTIQGWQLGSFQRVSNSFILPIKGASPAAGANLMRVSFAGPFNGGTITGNQELWTLRGTGTALDGNFMAQNAVPMTMIGGSGGILNSSMFAQFSVAAASQGATSLTATSASAVAALGKGCVLATAGSAGSGPSQTIGVIDSISGTTINLAGTTGIPAALNANAAVYCYPWVDMVIPTGAPSTALAKIGGNVQTGSVKVNDPQITVPDTSLFSVGMGVQGYYSGAANQQADLFNGPFVPDDTYVKSIDSPTLLTLSRPIATASTGKWITIAPVLRGNKTGASYFYNMFVGNNLTGAPTEFASRSSATNQGYEAFFDSVFGGIAAWNVFDFNRNQLPFYINDPAHVDAANGFTGQLGQVYSASQINAYNQPLGAPPNVKATPLGGGQIKIEFDAVAGARAYTYTVNGGQNFSLDPKNNQSASNGTIVSGAVISGLSGTVSVGVATLIGANDIGVPVIRGAVSPLQSVSVAA